MRNAIQHSGRSIVVQKPLEAQQLFLLFHGVGAQPESMLGIAKLLNQEFPMSMIVSIAAPHPCDLGAGYQWFSVRGVTEENRPRRVRDAYRCLRKKFYSGKKMRALILHEQP